MASYISRNHLADSKLQSNLEHLDLQNTPCNSLGLYMVIGILPNT